MLFRFIRTIIHFAEWMFVVANHVREDFECLRHGLDPLFVFLETASSENNASAPGLRQLLLISLPSRLLKLLQLNLTPVIVKRSTVRCTFCPACAKTVSRAPCHLGGVLVIWGKMLPTATPWSFLFRSVLSQQPCRRFLLARTASQVCRQGQVSHWVRATTEGVLTARLKGRKRGWRSADEISDGSRLAFVSSLCDRNE